MSRQSQERFLRTSDDFDYVEKKDDEERLSLEDPLAESTMQQMHVFDDVSGHALDPRNWPNWKRHLTALVIAFYTCAVYSGSSIVMLSIIDLMGKHTISQEYALASLSLYVLGYGLGPLIWAPLSEIRWIGRKPVYVVTILAFVPLSYAAYWASDKSIRLFLLFRFLQGYFGSPCLANGGASMHDLYGELELPYALGLWIAFAYAGPALGPAMAANGYDAYGFTFPMKFVFYLSIPAAVALCIAPETYLPKIIYSRGNYSRVAGDERHHVETDGAVHDNESVWATIKDSLIKPLEISMLDPSVNFVNGYSSALYCFFYSYFDALPLVFLFKYGWKMSEVARACTFIMIGCILGCVLYFWYVHKVANPAARAGKFSQEDRLKPAILAAAAIPVGILIFAFATIDGKVYWMVSMIGLCIYAASVFVILQCLSMYTLKSYPQYAASLFAANDACRSLLATGGVHAGMPFYQNLGTFWGCVILAGITFLGLPGIIILYMYGSRLRAKSRFAAK